MEIAALDPPHARATLTLNASALMRDSSFNALTFPPTPLPVRKQGAKGKAQAQAQAPAVDADLTHLREFLPPQAPVEADALAKWLFDPERRFAFCLVLHSRTSDAAIDEATGLALSLVDKEELPPQERSRLYGTRPPTVRIESIYEIDGLGDTR